MLAFSFVDAGLRDASAHISAASEPAIIAGRLLPSF